MNLGQRRPGKGPDGMRVALFITCYNDLLFPDVGQAMVRLLRRLGQEVEFPAEQTCCGQMHFNSGYQDACIPLVERFAAAFAGYDAIVTPSGSCAAMVRHHHPLVAALAAGQDASTGLPAAVEAVAPRVFELTEFLVDVLGVTDVGARFPHTVAFHPTCHSTRLLGVGSRPTQLLEAVEGLTLVDLPRSDACCGFGGTFAVKNADTSVAMGLDKVDDVLGSGAEVLTAGDTSCLMHIGGLLSRRRSPIRVMHIAEILAQTGTGR
jgi:L-lactate dehydrogenase complex protein LldE